MHHLHRHLMRESALYRSWHYNHPFSQVAHWGLFIVAALAFTYSMSSGVLGSGAGQVAAPVIALNNIVAPATPTPSTDTTPTYETEIVPADQIVVGDHVTVTADLNVRDVPNGEKTGEQVAETKGEVIGGPVPLNSHLWWNVDFESGVDGWVVEDNLAK